MPDVETTLPRMLDKAVIIALTRSGKKVRDAVRDRDQLIRAAVEAGGSLREVGEAVGLSHTAVKFIAHGRPESQNPPEERSRESCEQ